MGCCCSAERKKLSRELPPAGKLDHDGEFHWVDSGNKIFTDEEDRQQFIGTLKHADWDNEPAKLT